MKTNNLANNLVFYDVDTEKDFMDKDGKLSVPNAEEIKKNLELLTNYARANAMEIGIKQYKSRDRHFGTLEYSHLEGELQKYGGPFPEHCMDGTPGWENIPETAPLNPVFVQNKEYSTKELSDLLEHEGEIIIEKQSYTIFKSEMSGNYGNMNAEKIAAHQKGKTMVMYGVATDYCVKAAAIGFAERGVNVYVVEDAIRAVNVNPADGEKALAVMKAAGVKFVTTKQVLDGQFK